MQNRLQRLKRTIEDTTERAVRQAAEQAFSEGFIRGIETGKSYVETHIAAYTAAAVARRHRVRATIAYGLKQLGPATTAIATQARTAWYRLQNGDPTAGAPAPTSRNDLKTRMAERISEIATRRTQRNQVQREPHAYIDPENGTTLCRKCAKAGSLTGWQALRDTPATCWKCGEPAVPKEAPH